MFRKAQSAMEYLMTYGWAILIILIAVGALFYLGVFSPKTPSVCQLEAPFVCKDMVINNNGILFEIAGTNINSGEVTDVKINGQSCSTLNGFLYNTNIQGETYTGCGVDLSNNKKVTGNININYNAKSGLSHSIEGEYSGSIEEGSIINIIEGSNNGIFNLNNNGLIFGWHGDSLNDYIGGLGGTLNGGLTVSNTDGYLGRGTKFDSINDYISFPYTAPVNFLNTEGTFSAWVNTTNSSGGIYNQVDILGFDSTATNYLYIKTNLQQLRLGSSPCIIGSVGKSYNDGNWHYVTLVINQTHYVIYGDAVFEGSQLKTSGACTFNTLITKVYIGYRQAYFNGTIDELHIWNRALSQEEIENLYSAMVY